MDTHFWTNQIIKTLLFHSLSWFEGKAVLKWQIKVNYTRKFHHFIIFLSPYWLIKILPYHETMFTQFAGPMISLLTLAVFMEPVRQRWSLFQTMFASIDRPEDRPHTLKWLTWQYVLTLAVAVPFSLYFHHNHLQEFMVMVILINAIGDGLAEPVGVTWGRHKYTVKAWFIHTVYTRSIEGSLCVFLTAFGIIICFSHMFSDSQFIAALITIPVSVTVAEAKSPHTLDSPFIFLTGCGLFALINLL